MLTYTWYSPGKQWIKGPAGWEEYSPQSEVVSETMHTSQVKKVIELFLMRKRRNAFQTRYSCISAAPVSKCSTKESVEWLQISSHGSRECHGYSSLGELLRRLRVTNSIWQEGRFHYVMCLCELIVKKKFQSLSGTSRKNLFVIIDTLVERVVTTKESIRQMNRIVCNIMDLMIQYEVSHIGCKQIWFEEIETVRTWTKKLHLLNIRPRVDLSMTLTDLPIELQRMILNSLSDHHDIESMSHVNKNFQFLCNEPDIWRNLCHHHFTKTEIDECEAVLERRRLKSLQAGKTNVYITWKVKYHFLLRRYEMKEEFADPLMLCGRCQTLFWQDTGHPCISDDAGLVHEKISPQKLISLF